MAGEPLLGVVLLDHRVRADRGRGGLAETSFSLRHLPIRTRPRPRSARRFAAGANRLAAGCETGPSATLAIAVTAAVLLSAAARAEAPSGHYPWAKRVAAAKRFAEHAPGRISFAVVDESGRLHGVHPDRVHNSASVVKVLFMVALLREPDVRDDELTDAESGAARADDHALRQRRRRPRSSTGSARRRSTSSPTRPGSTTSRPSRLWGLTTITAGSQARFFSRLRELHPEAPPRATRCTC